MLAQRLTAQELEQRLQFTAGEIAIGVRAADDLQQLCRRPALVERHADDALCQYVGRLLRDGNTVNLPGVGGVHQHRTLDQVVGVKDDEPPFRNSVQRVAGTADALQSFRYGLGRANLHYQVDVPDVDTQLQTGRGDDRVHLAILQFLLDIQPHFL